MAIFDKLKTLVGVEDDDFEEDYLDEEPIQPTPRHAYGLGDRDREQTTLRERPAWTPSPKSSTSPSSIYGDRVRPLRQGSDSVLTNSAGSTLRALTQKFKIVVVEPRVFEDSTKLVDSLKARKPVIINFEKVEHDTAKQIYFFLNGATYALSGNVQKIANNIFVFLPENVDITTDTDKGFGSSDGSPWQR